MKTPEMKIPELSKLSPLDKQAMELLSSRLTAAESETQQLAEQLSLMASNSTSSTLEILDTTDSSSTHPDIVFPFEIKNLKTSEALTSRLCKAESAVAALKLAVATLQNDECIKNCSKSLSNQESLGLKKASKQEIDKLRDEMVCLQQELVLEKEAKTRNRSQVEKLQETLMEATQLKTEISQKADQFENENKKLVETLSELEKQLLEKEKTQENLEISYFSLLNRIEEMESIMDCEKNEVEGLTSMYNLLQQEMRKSKTNFQEEKKQRIKIEKTCQILLTEKNKLEDLYEQSETSNKTLLRELDDLRTRHSQLLEQFEQIENNFEKQKIELNEEKNSKVILEEEISNLKPKIEIFQKELTETKQELLNQKNKLKNYETELKCKEEIELKYQKEMKDNFWLKEQIAKLQKEKVLAISEKENLEEKGQVLLQETIEQKFQLESECENLTSDLNACKMSKKLLEEDHVALQQKLDGLERQQAATEQIENVMKEMLQQKNKLAYEKGNLQSQVQQLQTRLAKIEQKDSHHKQLTELNSTLQNKYIQIQTDLKESKTTIKELEKQVSKQEKENSLKTENLQEMKESWQKVRNENEFLKQEVKDIKNKTQQKLLLLEKNADNTKMDNKKLAQTLQTLIRSHNQLEKSTEELQVELGQKDSKINILQEEKLKSQNQMSNLKTELINQQKKLMSIASSQNEELSHVRNSLLKSKETNKKMCNSVEEVLKCNISLQENIETLMVELKEKKKNVKEIQKLRLEEKKKFSGQEKNFENQIDSLRQQLQQQNTKNENREIVEIKSQNDHLLVLNRELSQLNSELREKLSLLETKNKEWNDKLCKFENPFQENKHQIKLMKTNLKDVNKSKQTCLEENNKQDEKEFEMNPTKLIQITEDLKKTREWFGLKFDHLLQELLKSKQLRQDLKIVEDEECFQLNCLEEERIKGRQAAKKAQEILKGEEIKNKWKRKTKL